MLRSLISKFARTKRNPAMRAEVATIAPLVRVSTAQERCDRRKRDHRTVTRTCSCCLLSFGDHSRCCGHRSANLFIDGR